MKKTIQIFILLLGYIGVSQSLGLNDLQNICNKKSSELVNQYMMNKGWEYYDSNKGNSEKYNTVTWAFEKSSYNDKAQGWFYLFTYEGSPNKISYSVFNKTSYGKIKKSLLSYGYKLKDDLIEDKQIKSIYENSKYRLEITTGKRKVDDSYDRSMTSYGFLLIKKSGIYDPNNGTKTINWSGTNVPHYKYTLKNGLYQGRYERYYKNGSIELRGNYINDKKDGVFKEYEENGDLKLTYKMFRGKLHGEMIKFIDGIISFKKMFNNGLLNGKYEGFFSNGNKSFIGSYVNDKKNGKFNEYNESGDLVLSYEMIKDSLHGKMKKYRSGSLLYSKNYKNGFLDGDFTEYIFNDDNNELIGVHKGVYKNGKKNGRFNIYDLNEEKKEILLITRGFKNGLLEGAYQTIKGDSIIFGNYKNNKLEGKYLIYRDYLKMFAGGKINTDTISKNVSLETKGQYFDDLKDGVWNYYGLNNNLVKKGSYSEGKKNGNWKYYYSNYENGKTGEKLKYSGELYLTEDYKNGHLHGKRIVHSRLDEEEYPCEDKSDGVCYKFIYKKIHLQENYINGFLDGKYSLKDSNDFLISEGSYHMGKKNGEWVTREAQEENIYLVEKGNYSNGEKDGLFQYYYNDDLSTKFMELNFNNDKLNGEVKLYSNGEVNILKHYNNGSLSNINYFNNNELVKSFEIIYSYSVYKKVLKTDYYNNGEERSTYRFENIENFDVGFSNDIFEESLEKGKAILDGDYYKIDVEGRVLESGKKYKNDKIGTWVYNFFNQNICRVINHDDLNSEAYFLIDSNNKFSGEFKLNHEGSVEEIKVKNGLRDGATVFRDLNGKKIKKIKYKEGNKKD